MGLIAALVSAVLSSMKDLISKQVSFSVSGGTSAFASFAFALPFYALFILGLTLCGINIFTFGSGFLLLVLLRSLTDAGAESAKMCAFQYGDISLVSCYISLTPLFLLVTSPLITGDTYSATGAVGVLFTVTGSLVAFPIKFATGIDRSQLKGVLFAIVSAVFFSLNSCFDRLAVQEADPILAGFAMTLVAAAILLPLVIRRGTRAEFELIRGHQKLLWGRGLIEVLFMVTKLFALQFIQAPYVSGIGKLSLLISILGGRFIFKEGEFLRRLLAAMLIIVGVIIIALESLP